jgi:activator of Hsp90 ATPase-like protein
MIKPDEPAGRSVVTPLRRPPVRQSTVVRASVEHTFGTFVTKMGAWWPVQPFSAGRDRVRDVTVEQRRGGRVYETWDDGTEIDWGTLIVWEPPERFVMSWTGTPVTTEVELAFAPLGPALTRVTLEHRGWDALTEEQLAADCALPGGYTSGAYATGWATILACLAETIAASGDESQPDRGGR